MRVFTCTRHASVHLHAAHECSLAHGTRVFTCTRNTSVHLHTACETLRSRDMACKSDRARASEIAARTCVRAVSSEQ
eukprot:465455-Rhodomonas_salina.1